MLMCMYNPMPDVRRLDLKTVASGLNSVVVRPTRTLLRPFLVPTGECYLFGRNLGALHTVKTLPVCDSVPSHTRMHGTERPIVSIFVQMQQADAEQVVFWRDAASGARGIIVLHSTVLGPVMVGVRMWPYADEAAALADGFPLAQAMSLKASAAGLDLGGGTCLVFGDPLHDKNEAVLLAVGRVLARFGGRVIPVNDVGTNQADMQILAQVTSPVCAGGDPSPFTALGVLEAIRGARQTLDGTTGLQGLRVVVQGVGNLGSRLVGLLRAEGAEVMLADINAERAAAVAAQHGATVVDPDTVLSTPCDVLAPCALGAVVNDATLPTLACRMLIGGANSILATPQHADALQARGIHFMPDYISNVGGLIFLEGQILGHDVAQSEERVRGIGSLVSQIFADAARQGVTTSEVAHSLALQRLQAAAG